MSGINKRDGGIHPLEPARVAEPGTAVVAAATGKISRIRVYSDEEKKEMTGVRIKTEDGHEIDAFYVDADSNLKDGAQVRAGDTIGKAQDVSGMYRRLNPKKEPMTNHVHVQVKKPGGEFVDPTPYIAGWAPSQGHPEWRGR